MGCTWDKVALGDTGLRVAPLGLSASYGASASDVQRAFDRGINYFYWGSMRTATFGEGLKTLARNHRTDMVVVIQTYTRFASLMGWSLDRALRKLSIDYADFLLLGWWNKLPPRRILDTALKLKQQGKVKHLLISGHNRPSFETFIQEPAIDAIMVRYNAAHTGAEQEVFPHLSKRNVGVTTYTATRWAALLDPAFTPPGDRTPTAPDCYRFNLTNPHVNLVMLGPKNTAQLDEAMTALDKGPMSEEELQWMRRVGKAVRARNRYTDRLRD
ncbi:MAG: aldo/keto reductase [Deltaproteobacteria bacterium]|nr:aldo/keto reductase [Deltaproteobacteria bacterium]